MVFSRRAVDTGGKEHTVIPNPGRPDVIVRADAEDVIASVARRIAALLTSAVSARGVVTMALAGGNTPRRLYRALSAPPYDREVPWDRVRLFLGDERWVPADHPDSNQRMVRESLLAALPARPAFHPFPSADRDPHGAAGRYAECLAAEIPETLGPVPRLDLILLGMGADGHTASLFPGTGILEAQEAVAAVFVPGMNVWRLSLTLPVLNAARNVLFLVTGADKAAAVAQVFADGPRKELPASLVRPVDGGVDWYLDREAAAQLAGTRTDSPN
jgi:6-phosphogluconolactonase